MTKELANIILGEEYDSLQEYNTEQIMNNSNTMSANDFASKCKKWANSISFVPGSNHFEHCYNISSVVKSSGEIINKVTGEIANYGKPKATVIISITGDVKNFFEESEPEAIFKACEWILNSQK